jgi:Mn-dependent DtxR family transcriptional regulator
MIKSGNKSSSAAEDYLERIQELIEAKGYARMVDIAASLGISQASVTNMVKRLDAEGFVLYENTGDWFSHLKGSVSPRRSRVGIVS